MKTAIILLVLCAFACVSATSIKKSHLRSKSTLNAQVLTEDNFFASCNNLVLSGTTLQASCLSISGDWKATQLDLNTCLGNSNTAFACGSNYGPTARNQKVSGSTLSADLQNSNGAWVTTSVNLSRFLSNTDGQLVCDCQNASQSASAS